jgi:ribosomal protein S18 acetylase RimI-like enzyme
MINYFEATEDDAIFISEIRKKCWLEAYCDIYSDELINDFDYEFHIKKILNKINDFSVFFGKIVSDNELIGYYSYGKPRCAVFSNQGIQIYSLYILKEYHSKGIGKEVIKEVISVAKSKGMKYISLTCNYHNVQAKGFYQHMKFEPILENIGNENKEEDQVFYQRLI